VKGIEYVNLLAVVLTAGWASAFLTQLIKRASWSSWVKLVLAIVVAGLVGLATAWITGDVSRFVTLWKSGGVTSNEILVLGALVFTSAQVWYHKFFADQAWAQALGKWPSK
jgi:hypothetical protein